jgi:hypothetical protein
MLRTEDTSGTAEAPAEQANAVRPLPPGRNGLIDALKFFAIALVILTHVLRLRGEVRRSHSARNEGRRSRLCRGAPFADLPDGVAER